MFVGPWAVMLFYAHAIVPVLGKGPGLLFLGIAFVAGMSGALLLGPPFTRWHPVAIGLCLLAIAGFLIASLPFIALLSVCSTGDCL